jgi:predicted NBD/HSP70 family sugar kinase
MKGVGVAVEGVSINPASIRASIAEIFGVPVAVGSVALACGKWFLLTHKDAKLASAHLLSVHIDHEITLGAIIAGRPLKGAHGRAVNLLSLVDPEGACNADCESMASVNGTAPGKNVAVAAGECLGRVADAISMGVAAYDPGLVLISGNFASEPESAEQHLAGHLESIGADGTTVRVLDTSGEGASIYRRGAMGLILSHFLEECGD